MLSATKPAAVALAFLVRLLRWPMRKPLIVPPSDWLQKAQVACYVPAFLGGGNMFFNFGGNKVFSVVHGLVADFSKIEFGEPGKNALHGLAQVLFVSLIDFASSPFYEA